ncbi:MAG: hypothetical protein K0Q49_1858 [Haloplasmataceae bacterium]|jgi:uncharacterized membrane protein|nr:hypothetical protein [Haloplasmataceae bacterium]
MYILSKLGNNINNSVLERGYLMLNQVAIESMAELIFYFTLYSFIGWLIENTHSYFVRRKFLKDNFIIGPFKPMYGITPILLVIYTQGSPSWVYVLIICYFVPLIIEYMTGFLILDLFHRRYWDYSSQRFQLGGQVCFTFSLFWVILSVACIKWIHPALSTFYLFIETYWEWSYILVFSYFVIEILASIERHTQYRFKVHKPVKSLLNSNYK